MQRLQLVQVVRTHPDKVDMPQYRTNGSAGFDLQSRCNTVVYPGGEIVQVGTGLKVALPEGVMLYLRQRSGLSLEYPNYLVNSPGVIDSDFRGEIMLNLVNHTNEPWLIKTGDRIAQGILIPVCTGIFRESAGLPPTQRGEGGHGSTGI